MDRMSRRRRPWTMAVAFLALAIVGVPTATGASEPWVPVDLVPFVPPADLVASDADAAGISPTTRFRLTSLDGTPVRELLAGLGVEPAVQLEPVGADDGTSLTLRPTEALQAGRDYRFTLHGRGGALVASWAFRTRAPLRVVGTLPSDGASRVPVDTGIEITFDRGGVRRAERYFDIEPKVAGRFEVHDERLVFVPRRPLASDTVYRVLLRAGLPLEGSSTRLEDGLSFRFRTARSGPRPRPPVTFSRPVSETSTAGTPVIRVDWYRGGRTLPLEVYRLGSFEAALSSVAGAQASRQWSEPLAIDTAGLPLVGSHRLEVRGGEYPGPEPWVELPGPLPAGWYVLVLPHERGDAQMILQVSDLAVFAQTSVSRSIAWVNDGVTGEPVAGARVSLADGTSLGRTDADGLAIFDTPGSLLGSDPSLLIVRDAARAVLVPFGAGGWESRDIVPCWTYNECAPGASSDGDDWWALLYTDRRQYRPTDSVGVFGTLRHRDTDVVPELVEVRVTSEEEGVTAPPPVASLTVRPAASGAFSARIGLDRLPFGWYDVELRAGDATIDATWIEVAPIVKPEYQLGLSTSRHVAVAGEALTATVQATFFDGTSVPALPLSVAAGSGPETVVTDAFGSASRRLRVDLAGEDQWTQWSWRTIEARPARGEEAEIADLAEVLVFRSGYLVSGEATIGDGRASLEGTVHRVALPRLERAAAAALDAGAPSALAGLAGDFDPRGQAVAGATVTARVTELIPVRTQTGTVYDFIAKKAVPVYRYSQRREPLGTFELVSGSDGAFELGFPADATNGYWVDLESSDASGRTTRTRVYAHEPEPEDAWFDAVYVAPPGTGPSAAWYGEDAPDYAVGEPVVLELHAGTEPQASGGLDRHLFTFGQRGLQRTLVQGSARLAAPFLETDVPAVTIGGVRWTGSTYLADAHGYTARVRPDDRRIDVELTPDRTAYRPGEEVVLDIRTTGPDGQPVSADVLVRAVDEKLFAIGAAEEIDPLADLYEPVGAGWLGSYASHQVPRAGGGDGAGDAAGGGGRQDFRDALTFRMLRTDADGEARLSFALSDDLTSWRVGATAVTADLRAGEGKVLVPVGLPFFVEVVTASEYLATDEAAIRVRGYGRGLEAGDVVDYEVDLGTLGGPPVELRAEAFDEVVVPLPALTLGSHAITVTGRSGTGTQQLRDALQRTFTVVGSHLERSRMEQAELTTRLAPAGGPGLTSVVVSDAGRGRFAAILSDLAGPIGPRADQAIAATEARRLLADTFSVDPASLGRSPQDAGQFQASGGGISLLPYADADLELSMLAAIAAPDVADATRLARYLRTEGRRQPGLRRQAIMALAGLSALGEPVLGELRSAAGQAGLSLEERLHVAIGLAEAGDHAAAMGIERALLAEAGEQRGPWVRLRGETPSETSELTALLSVLAAGVGDDDVAAAADAYVRDDPPTETLASLQRLAFTTRSLERATSAAGRFAWTLGGAREVVDLGPGETFVLRVTADQLAALTLEPVAGELSVTSTWAEPLGDEDLEAQDEAIVIRRTVTPAGVVADDATLRVRLDVRLRGDAIRGCYLVSEQVPAGLAPVRMGARRQAELEPGVEGPWAISGQRVTFCAFRDPEDPLTELGYEARVVTPGRYAWEPTVVQSVRAPESWRLGSPGLVETR